MEGTVREKLNPVCFVQDCLAAVCRNFSDDATGRNIELARKSLNLSDGRFRQRVTEIIDQVQRTYRDLVFAIPNEKIARDSADLARTQLEKYMWLFLTVNLI